MYFRVICPEKWWVIFNPHFQLNLPLLSGGGGGGVACGNGKVGL